MMAYFPFHNDAISEQVETRKLKNASQKVFVNGSTPGKKARHKPKSPKISYSYQLRSAVYHSTSDVERMLENALQNSPSKRQKVAADFCQSFRQEYRDQIGADHDLWLGVDGLKENNTFVIVLTLPHFPRNKIENYKGICVQYRLKDETSVEARKCAAYSPPYKWRYEERQKVSNIVRNHAPKLMQRHSKLTVVSGSSFRSTRKGKTFQFKREMCVVLYVRVKGIIPFEEEPFPDKIGGLPVDVMEGYFSLCPNGKLSPIPSDYNNPLRMGCSIGVQGKDITGTFGGSIEVNKKLHFVTCAHVVFPAQRPPSEFTYGNTPCTKINIVQPPDGEGCRQNEATVCGHVVKSIFETRNGVFVDVAFIKLHNEVDISEGAHARPSRKRLPSGLFSGLTKKNLECAGFNPNDPPTFKSGNVKIQVSKEDMDKRVVKCGAASGLTRGVFEFEGAAVRVDQPVFKHKGEEIIVQNQYMIKSVGGVAFFQSGDSGSLVFLVDQDENNKSKNRLQCIGLAIGTTDWFNCVVTPIQPVLDSLQLPYQFKQFIDQPKENPMKQQSRKRNYLGHYVKK